MTCPRCHGLIITRVVEYPDITETKCLCCGWYLNEPLPLRDKPTYRPSGIKRGTRQYPRTHCARGHEYTKENTYLYEYKTGGFQRKCRICNRMLYRQQEDQRRRKVGA